MDFNLPAPPGFRGFDPVVPMTMYQRHLPHWRQDGATYFVTFHTADALPKSVFEFRRRLLAEWQRQHPLPWSDEVWREYARTILETVERNLDEGYGACHLRAFTCRSTLEELMTERDSSRCAVGCWVVMPNHVHALLQPALPHTLERILQRWKSQSAIAINAAAQRTGRVWQQESYDRIVRDEEHLWRVVQYIGRNPSQANLPAGSWSRWMNPDWEAVGWRFVDVAGKPTP
jgi:putative transposase